jgi:hypothetical protein
VDIFNGKNSCAQLYCSVFIAHCFVGKQDVLQVTTHGAMALPRVRRALSIGSRCLLMSKKSCPVCCGLYSSTSFISGVGLGKSKKITKTDECHIFRQHFSTSRFFSIPNSIPETTEQNVSTIIRTHDLRIISRETRTVCFFTDAILLIMATPSCGFFWYPAHRYHAVPSPGFPRGHAHYIFMSLKVFLLSMQ